MISRRNLIKSLGLSAFTLPSLTSFSNRIPEKDVLLSPDDPDFWKSVRNQFTLDKRQSVLQSWNSWRNAKSSGGKND